MELSSHQANHRMPGCTSPVLSDSAHDSLWSAPWFFVENYMYRRILDVHGRSTDPFRSYVSHRAKCSHMFLILYAAQYNSTNQFSLALTLTHTHTHTHTRTHTHTHAQTHAHAETHTIARVDRKCGHCRAPREHSGRACGSKTRAGRRPSVYAAVCMPPCGATRCACVRVCVYVRVHDGASVSQTVFQ